MKKILFFMMIALAIVGCNKEDEKEKQEPYKMSYENFCELYFDGYLVNDTTGLINLSREVKKPNEDGTIYLVGTKSGKCWIGKFDTKNKKCIKEYISKDDFPIDFVYDLGYGKSEIAHMDYLNVQELFETSKGFVCSIQSQYSLYTVYIFNSTNTKYYLCPAYEVYKGLSKWYNETFLMRQVSGKDDISCLDEEGNILCEGWIDNFVLSSNYIPINLKDFIYVNYDNRYIYIKNGTLQGQNTPSKRINLFSRTEEKEIFTCEFGNIENDILQLKLTTTGKSGGIQNKDYKINVKTFELAQ